jgi:hypothetical protein
MKETKYAHKILGVKRLEKHLTEKSAVSMTSVITVNTKKESGALF